MDPIVGTYALAVGLSFLLLIEVFLEHLCRKETLRGIVGGLLIPFTLVFLFLSSILLGFTWLSPSGLGIVTSLVAAFTFSALVVFIGEQEAVLTFSFPCDTKI